MVVPKLDDKVFSEYIYILTLCLIISRLICWGINDQIPIIVPKSQIHKLNFWALLFLIISTILVAIGIQFKIDLISTVAIVVIMITESILEGMLISISMKTYEKLLNFPWIVFLIIVLLFPVANAYDLLNFYCIAYIITHVFIFFIFMGVQYRNFFKDFYALSELVKLFQGGYLKVIGQLLILVNIRGVILLPKLLRGVIVSDTIALGITIAESVSTVFMVILNRNFSKYCQESVAIIKVYLNAVKIPIVFFLSGLMVAFVCYSVDQLNVFYFKFDLSMEKLNPANIIGAFGIFTVALAFIEIRNYWWGRKEKELILIGILVLSFMIQALISFLFTDASVFIIPISCAMILYLFLALKIYKFKGVKRQR